MGTIVSPANGSNFYKGQTIPISYRSDTVDFDCGSSTKICTVFYYVDGIGPDVIPISQNGVAPQTQADQNVTLPLIGTTATVDIDARGVGGQQNDTATATYNLIDAPTSTCDPATLVTSSDAQLNGTLAGTLLAGGSARFVWGAGVPNTNESTLYATGSVSASLTGLSPSTTYDYRLEVLDEFGNIVATSGNCQLTTSAAPVASSSNAQLVKLCTITGVSVLRDCTTNDPVLLVSVSAADGDVIPVDSTEFPAVTGAGIFSTIGFYRSYYADTLGNYLSPQPTTVCLPTSTSAPALDTILVCGVVGGVSKPLIRRETIDADGNVDESFVDTDGVDEIPTSWTPGPCVNHLTSTIERVTGAGTVTIAANARSITVSVSAGNPTVQIGSDPAVALIPNLSLTWGTDSREEDLADVFTFTGLTGDDFFVTTSRL